MTPHTRTLHELRNGQRHGLPVGPAATPELADAWRSLQLHWLSSLPGYRERVKARVSEERKLRAVREARMERHMPHLDIDLLGREIEGCG